MTFLTELRECVDVLSAHPELDVEPELLLARLRSVGGDGAVAVLADAAAVTHCVERVTAVAAAVISELSTRDRGQGGFAATKGHRSPVTLVQSISGGSKADAVRTVRVGESLTDAATAMDADWTPGDMAGTTSGPNASDGEPDSLAAVGAPWHYGLSRALLRGAIHRDEHHAILKGLGDPPLAPGATEPSETAVEVWAIAAEQLMAGARTAGVTAEELLRRARTVRDVLDPVGAEQRFARRYQNRSFRMWVDGDGAHHGHFVFDDEMAAWVRSLTDAALRPRRGGPRFVDTAEAQAAKALTDDPRTNDQLAYDLMVDVLRAGALADASKVFGSRQPGVRMMIVKDAVGPRDASGRLLATGHLEDGGDTLPGPVIDRQLCQHGGLDLTVDACGNPLDVGREQRLFTPRQRIALAARDGGCLWPGCGLPASYCEAHHADQWDRDDGRTDIDRGLLLCRFHHMTLHHHGWRITRDAHQPFVLHPPPATGGKAVVLISKAAWKWAWDPPPDRTHWRAAQTPPVLPAHRSSPAA